MLTSIATGQDVAAHLAEEARYPTKTVPRAVFWSTAFAYMIGWALMLSLMAVLPQRPLADYATSRFYGAPAQILNTVLPQGLAFTILVLLIILMQAQDVAQLLASSRFVWALARDSALPGSRFVRPLSAARIPVRATFAISTVVFLSLLLVATGKQIVTSLALQGGGASIVLAYSLPVWCYLTCPNGALDVDGRNEWTLKRWSKLAAAIGGIYSLLIIIVLSWPTGYPITASKSKQLL